VMFFGMVRCDILYRFYSLVNPYNANSSVEFLVDEYESFYFMEMNSRYFKFVI
jgi:pyruvate carboxylase